MTKKFIDFTVFESPRAPYARVCGELDLPDDLSEGDLVALFDANADLVIQLPVQYLAMTEHYGSHLVGLEDVVAESRGAAVLLCQRLATRGLDIEPFSIG